MPVKLEGQVPEGADWLCGAFDDGMDINAYAPDLEYAVRPSPLDQGQVVDKVLVRGRGPGPQGRGPGPRAGAAGVK